MSWHNLTWSTFCFDTQLVGTVIKLCQAGPPVLAFMCAGRCWSVPTNSAQVSRVGGCIGLTLKGSLVSLFQTTQSQPPHLPVSSVVPVIEVPQKSFCTCNFAPHWSPVPHICIPLSLNSLQLLFPQAHKSPVLVVVLCAGLRPWPLSCGSPDPCANVCQRVLACRPLPYCNLTCYYLVASVLVCKM